MSYETILIFDEDDTPAGDLMSLYEFLDYIDLHKEGSGVKSDKEIFVRISNKEYDDEDNGGTIDIAQIEFLVKK